MILIAIAPDVEALNYIQNLLNATGAAKRIAEVPNIVVPREKFQIVLFAEKVKHLAPYLKDVSKISAVLFEIELQQLPKP